MSSAIAVMLVILNIKYVATIRYSHTITEDKAFYYKQLTTFPSLIMEVEFSILCIDNSLKLNMYATRDNINLRRNCSVQHYGQLFNEDLWFPLRSGSYRHYVCLKKDNGLLHCTGKTVIQDFKVRNLSFSIGYYCDHPKASIKGLSFNISVSGQRNKSNCVPLNTTSCSKFYSFASFLNLLGFKLQEAWYNGGTLWKIVPVFRGCYKFLREMICHLYIPKCDVMRSLTIPPCRENCWDFQKGCLGILKKMVNYTGTHKTWLNCNYLPKKGSSDQCFYRAVNCNVPPRIPNGKIEGGDIINGTYPLHTQLSIMCTNETFVMKGNSTITCGYSGTWSKLPQCVLRACSVPPSVDHAHIEEHQNGSKVYPWQTQVTYTCDNETYHMEGNSTITCLKNGHWSSLPDCIEITDNKGILKTLKIVLPTAFLILLFILSSCLVVCYKRKLKIKHILLAETFTLDNTSLTRIKKYDAFICYQFDADDDFVKNTIIPELEQNYDPPFKLCIFDNAFLPGTSILDNIQVAIENSNSAIVVLSQGFVDSMWCQQEFQLCYLEHMKDPAYKLFVIMMQPKESLQNLTEFMEEYLTQEIYLTKDDKKLFTKIASYLTQVKKAKDNGEQGEIEVNPKEEEGQGHLENVRGIPQDNQDVPEDIVQNDGNDNTTDDRRTDDVDVIVHHHENINSDLNDVIVGIDDIDDVINDDEIVPLLV